MSACVLFKMRDYILVFVLLYISTNGICSPKLNVPRVLLPVFQDLCVNFTLEITGGGCYLWTTTRPDLIQLQEQIVKGCSQNVTITVLSREMTKKTAIVYAKNLNVDQTLRADVILDVITSLKISTKSRELYMEEPPQMFEVRAYDIKGNEFTTLEGVEFKWSVRSISDSRVSVMKLLTFSESPYEMPPSVAAFDIVGRRGHIVLLEGIKTGTAEVIVQLPYLEYGFTQPALVQLVVVANLVIEPSNVYILPEDLVSFRLYQVRQGKRFEISATNKQFVLISDNNQIAKIENRKVRGIAVGKVEVMVRDMYIPLNETIKLPSALVVVTEPQYMTLSLLPHNTWTLTIGQKATIVPEVFEINGHKISLGENSLIETKIPEDIFDLNSQMKNGTAIGYTYRSGSGKVVSQLYGSVQYNIGAENVLDVYPKVSMLPKVLVLPWVPEYTSKLHGFNTIVTGGDNNFEWISDDSSVVKVFQDGSLKFIGPGSTTVSVFMKKNKNCNATSTIHLLPPEDMEILHNYTEIFVGDTLDLNIMLIGKIKTDNSTRKVYFDICSFLDFNIHSTHPFSKADVINAKNISGDGCAVTTVKAHAVGLGEITVTLSTSSHELSASISLASHRHLTTLQPLFSEEVILSLGSYYDIVYAGGPTPVFAPIGNKFTWSRKILRKAVLVMKADLYVYRVYCRRIGTGFVELELFTKSFSFHEIKATKRVVVHCKVPKRMEIIGSSDCSGNFPQRFISYTHTKMVYYVKVYDDDGNTFHNATSILMKWGFDNQSIAHFEQEDGLQLLERNCLDFILGSKHYIIVHTFQYYGDVIGKGWALGYKSDNPNSQALGMRHFSSRLNEIAGFLLSIVQEPSVEPSLLSLLNHPNNFEILQINGGSGYFSLELESPIVTINYNEKTRTAEIVPLNEGTSEIVLHDRCLPEVYPLKINVQVVSVAIVRISSPLKVQEGQHIKVIIRILDRDEKPLAIPNLNHAKLGFKMETSNPSIAEFDRPSKAQIDYLKGTIEVNLKGKSLGDTNIWVSWLDISSNVEHIQVFPKIRISPRNITLAVGSEMQISLTGGPLLDSIVNYFIGDPLITSVSNDAIIKGIRPGKTQVTAISMGLQGEIYSRDSIEVHVVPLTGIHIVIPTAKLGLGNTMPAWANGIPSAITPILLGSISPPLKFKWRFSVPNIIQIRDTLHNTNVQVLSENKLSVRIFAVNPGYTNLQLQVTGRGHDRTTFVFNSSIGIEVRNRLAWSKPNIDFSPLLMAPNTVYNLRTNTLEKGFKSIYSTEIWSTSNSEPLLTVNNNGLLKSNNKIGTAIISAKASAPDLTITEVALPVMVKEVHYLMINIATALEMSESVKSLPRGLYLNITVTYHDQYGYQFSVPPLTKPTPHCNICSKIHIEYSGSNHSIMTSLANAGNVILQIQDTISKTVMEDYIKIPIDNYILPRKTHFTVGEIVCFWTPLVSHSGTWKSDTNAIRISNDGVAVALRTGQDTITYSISSPERVVLSSINVEVLPLLALHVGPVANRSITNKVGDRYVIPVFLINEKQRMEPSFYKHCNTTTRSDVQPPFDCELHYTSSAKLYPITSIFYAAPTFDYDIGAYVCSIVPIKGASLETSKIESNITLSVTNHVSVHSSVFLNFHPQFAVNTDAVYFNQDTTAIRVKVFGSSNILSNTYIETSGHKFIVLGQMFYDVNQISFYIKKTELVEKEPINEDDDIYLLFTCALTLQKVKVPIIFGNEDSPPGFLKLFITYMASSLISSMHVASVTIVGVCLAIIAILVSLRYTPRFPEINNASTTSVSSVNFHPPAASSPLAGHTLFPTELLSPRRVVPEPLLASPNFIRSTNRGIRTSPSGISLVSSGSPQSQGSESSTSLWTPDDESIPSRRSSSTSFFSGQ